MNFSLFHSRDIKSSVIEDLAQNLLKEITQYMKQLDSKDLNQFSEKDRFTFDRIEGDFAICENRQDGSMIQVPKTLIDSSASIGSILRIENGKFLPCKEETLEARQTIKNLLDDLYS